ncbi:MAG: REP-associated tyrosine transposase [Candidatus Acidiferrales bacterium]
MQTFTRKRNRLPATAYRGPHSYFLTLCCHRRQRLFLDTPLVQSLLGLFENACHAHSFQICAYCFMPDHLHAVLSTDNLSAGLPAVVRAFKGAAVARARQLGISNLWQKRFYDHVIRSTDSMENVIAYVLNNPVRAGLVNSPGQWSFSGPPDALSNLTSGADTCVLPWKETLAG